MQNEHTVGELAEIVAPIGTFPKPATQADVELVLRRLRSWTLAGALPTIDNAHSGTGRHRRYGRGALYAAVVLNALAEKDQSVGVLVRISSLIRNCVGPHPLFAGAIVKRWQQAIDGTKQIYLYDIGGLRCSDADRTLADLDEFAVQGLVPSDELLGLLHNVDRALVVNLTRLFARLPK